MRRGGSEPNSDLPDRFRPEVANPEDSLLVFGGAAVEEFEFPHRFVRRRGNLLVEPREACGNLRQRKFDTRFSLSPAPPSIPSPLRLRLVECYEKFLEDDVEDEAVEEGEEDPNELPYPLLEDAVRNDDPAKLTIFLAICRAVSVEQMLPRAVSLEKPAVTCKLLESLPSEQHVPGLVRALRRWGRPEELIRRAVESFEDELADWHDDCGNGFFWYLYARDQPVSEAMIDALPEKVIATWERPNRYGIAPADLWRYYRTALQLPMKKPRARA